MSQEKLISIDLRGDFGFLKKPDYNEGMLLSYNMLHKPALLGILGAIIGLGGYQKKGELPEYYQVLNDIPVGIAPLEGSHEKGNFIKSSVKYSNTVGYANKDGNLLVEETMLIKPAYRCFLLLNLEKPAQAKLYDYLKTGQAEFVPYLGKNEYHAWWLDGEGNITFREYEFQLEATSSSDLKILTAFRKTITLKYERVEDDFMSASNPFEFVFTPTSFAYFERLPAGFHAQLFQYHLEDFTYSNFPLKKGVQLPNLYFLPELQGYVQLA
ncbi:CRISPR-associated protein Cas5 [Rufibacter quisquiliarum]|uniref:CRISPR-associated protein Cas5h n=1 Tax=Rufibacter quisquiliarum TaxID=1549639 RepID=A0A839GPD8_9BACT|nr:CRISPR-associated protein Cas5 [Rufibacter quisquiliarum]MBA9075711.1 CRISPR-associated protein Cas5h [Rufibacter quisquiliarum]